MEIEIRVQTEPVESKVNPTLVLLKSNILYFCCVKFKIFVIDTCSFVVLSVLKWPIQPGGNVTNAK